MTIKVYPKSEHLSNQNSKQSATLFSEQYENRSIDQSIDNKYQNFKAKVMKTYKINRKSDNPGDGYLVRMNKGPEVEVVIWKERSDLGPLRVGEDYRFLNFRVHIKRNYVMSLYSSDYCSIEMI